jgi:hypothetical protein
LQISVVVVFGIGVLSEPPNILPVDVRILIVKVMRVCIREAVFGCDLITVAQVVLLIMPVDIPYEHASARHVVTYALMRKIELPKHKSALISTAYLPLLPR